MALSRYEEQVVADLEAQFCDEETPPAPPRDFGKLALPVVCLLLGAAFLVAARDEGLVIRCSNLWGFSTSALTWGLALTGHAMLLVSAFLLGYALCELRDPRPARADTTAFSRQRVSGIR